jgi:hypothetical protein
MRTWRRVTLLRAIYDMVDRLKAWEAEGHVDGAGTFLVRGAGTGSRIRRTEGTRLGIATGMRAGQLPRLSGRLR